MELIYPYVKRGMDVILSLILLVLLSPLFLVIILLIQAEELGSTPLFKQVRAGRGRIPFTIYKFRSMRLDTPKDTPTHLLADPDRYITKIGKFLRKSSLDELPQLVNVLKGELSLVGPRPGLMNQTDLLAERDHYGANDIRPGITGWAQVNGRDELPIPVKAKLDGEYVQHMGPLMDLKCCLYTVTAVAKAKGVSEGSKS